MREGARAKLRSATGTLLLGTTMFCAAATALAMALHGQAADAEVGHGHNLLPVVRASISPTDLPSRTAAPITAVVGAELYPPQVQILPPTLRKIRLDVGGNLKVTARGLPTCGAKALRSERTARVLESCRSAVIGVGWVRIVWESGERARLPLLAFNAPAPPGESRVLIRARMKLPQPRTLLARGSIVKARKGRSIRVSLQIPPLADGKASILAYRLKIRRLFRYRGKRSSYLSASCPRYMLIAQFSFFFDGQPTKTERTIRQCRSPSADERPANRPTPDRA